MQRYTNKDAMIDAIAAFSLIPMAWAIWTLTCCVFA
jgi:hypothetical protein